MLGNGMYTRRNIRTLAITRQVPIIVISQATDTKGVNFDVKTGLKALFRFRRQLAIDSW